MSNRKTEYSRTDVYLDGGAQQPKHMFVRIADLIEQAPNRPARLLDVGAASGAFIQYVVGRFDGLRATGVDFDPALVDEARKRVAVADFAVGDANRLDGLPDCSFGVVTMTGTHSIFDDFRPSFSECIRVAARGGRVIVTGIFNPFPVDAQIHWRYGACFEDGWHPGYNLFSKLSVGAYLESQPKVRTFAFHPFSIPFDVPARDDPIRSWTERQGDGQRSFRNGIMPLNFEMLVVDLNEQ